MTDRERVETLLNIGAYTRGTNPQIDEAVEMWPHFMELLRQPIEQRVTLAEAEADMAALVQRAHPVASTVTPQGA